jgi:hypothetical protein
VRDPRRIAWEDGDVTDTAELREEDVSVQDRLDDRVSEAEGLADDENDGDR